MYLSTEEQHQLAGSAVPSGEALLQPLRTAPELHRLQLELDAAEGAQERAERRRLLGAHCLGTRALAALLLPSSRG